MQQANRDEVYAMGSGGGQKDLFNLARWQHKLKPQFRAPKQ